MTAGCTTCDSSEEAEMSQYAMTLEEKRSKMVAILNKHRSKEAKTLDGNDSKIVAFIFGMLDLIKKANQYLNREEDILEFIRFKDRDIYGLMLHHDIAKPTIIQEMNQLENKQNETLLGFNEAYTKMLLAQNEIKPRLDKVLQEIRDENSIKIPDRFEKPLEQIDLMMEKFDLLHTKPFNAFVNNILLENFVVETLSQGANSIRRILKSFKFDEKNPLICQEKGLFHFLMKQISLTTWFYRISLKMGKLRHGKGRSRTPTGTYLVDWNEDFLKAEENYATICNCENKIENVHISTSFYQIPKATKTLLGNLKDLVSLAKDNSERTKLKTILEMKNFDVNEDSLRLFEKHSLDEIQLLKNVSIYQGGENLMNYDDIKFCKQK